MAKMKKGKWMSDDAYNQEGKDEHELASDVYFHIQEAIDATGSQEGADMTGSVNSRSGEHIMGESCPGEPSLRGGKK